MRRRHIGLVSLIAAVALLACFIYISDRGEDMAREEEMRRLEDAVRQAAVACYAAEGYYPSDLDTLARDYSLRYNSEDYIVRYDFFADNVLPDIEVFSRR